MRLTPRTGGFVPVNDLVFSLADDMPGSMSPFKTLQASARRHGGRAIYFNLFHASMRNVLMVG